MTAFVIACLSCIYLFLFVPLVLRSISQLQGERVVFFNFHNGNLRARQLTGSAATAFAGTQLVGRIIILGGVLTGLLQSNLNIIVLSTLAGLAIGAVATAIGEREAEDVPGHSGFFTGKFSVRSDGTPFISFGRDDAAGLSDVNDGASDGMVDDIIADAEYRPLDAPPDDEKRKNDSADS